MRTLYESLFDIDDNIEAIDKIKDNPKAMLNRNCKDFEEVVEVFAKWFGCKPPKIRKSSKSLTSRIKNNGIKLYNDKLVEFNLTANTRWTGKVITLALWGDKLIIHTKTWYLKKRWGKPPVKSGDNLDLIGQHDREAYEWGTNLWEWLEMHIERQRLSRYALNKSDYICEGIFDIDDNIEDDSAIYYNRLMKSYKNCELAKDLKDEIRKESRKIIYAEAVSKNINRYKLLLMRVSTPYYRDPKYEQYDAICVKHDNGCISYIDFGEEHYISTMETKNFHEMLFAPDGYFPGEDLIEIRGIMKESRLTKNIAKALEIMDKKL